MGSYGRWQSVLHAQTNGVWQLPLRKTSGCFFPLFLFFITAWLTASAFYQTSIVYLCSVQSHLRWQAIHRGPLPFHSLPLFFLSFIFSVSFLSFLHCGFSSHRNKWVLNWHVVGLSPMEVHSFIIRSGKPHCNLGVIIIWRGIIPVRSANYSMCLDWDLKSKTTWNEIHYNSDRWHLDTE